ncbi:GNAT family N-acetyltransferase [Nocardioides anomalus]|uniref:GNAT family N-acetyltransferase n=1 Tax=Nocardioides anomalus TaxID=2712223 RepID=A0A6G6WBF0_9ACTN|nr:GNAT family N-acetyltransferase [Nocardioides anomalus]QIG42554.1 GNAT family N-acetyltransferase [Nocardioides anomalus]
MTWRRATAEDAVALRDLERAANVVGLAHVFGDRPFPDEGVLARWRATLAEPGVEVRLTDGALCAWDDTGRVRHLAVHPDRWGQGLGRTGLGLAVTDLRARGVAPWLWALQANHRARRLYAHLGWEPTGRTQPAEWPPYPTELQLRLPDSAHGR